MLRPRARWLLVPWSELPGWSADRASEAMPALLRSCERPAPAWAGACAPAPGATRSRCSPTTPLARAWLAAPPAAVAGGVARGRDRRPGHRLLRAAGRSVAPAAAGLSRRPARPAGRPRHAQALLDPAAARHRCRRRAARCRHARSPGVRDPLDALLLQVQGSGRLSFVDEQRRPRELVRMAYAGHNDQPYKSVGRWLVEQGELRARAGVVAGDPRLGAAASEAASTRCCWSNPRVVFFREEPLPDPAVGPKGAQGVPLTPGRSIAVDPQSVPYGTPVWLDTTEPLSATPLRRLVVAQDTGCGDHRRGARRLLLGLGRRRRGAGRADEAAAALVGALAEVSQIRPRRRALRAAPAPRRQRKNRRAATSLRTDSRRLDDDPPPLPRRPVRPRPRRPASPQRRRPTPKIEPLVLADAEWKKRLSPAAYQVLRHEGTERPGSSPLNDEKRKGRFVCAGCDLPLFTSDTKFESGTGWPSFYAVAARRVAHQDRLQDDRPAHRVPLRALRRPPGPRLRRRPASRPASAIATTASR